MKPIQTHREANYARCPWCGRQPIKLKRGRIQSHLTPGGTRCVGVGQPARKEQP